MGHAHIHLNKYLFILGHFFTFLSGEKYLKRVNKPVMLSQGLFVWHSLSMLHQSAVVFCRAFS